MVQNSFLQKVFLTIFFGLCAAGVVEFYKHFIWQANEDVNGAYSHPREPEKKPAR